MIVVDGDWFAMNDTVLTTATGVAGNNKTIASKNNGFNNNDDAFGFGGSAFDDPWAATTTATTTGEKNDDFWNTTTTTATTKEQAYGELSHILSVRASCLSLPEIAKVSTLGSRQKQIIRLLFGPFEGPIW